MNKSAYKTITVTNETYQLIDLAARKQALPKTQIINLAVNQFFESEIMGKPKKADSGEEKKENIFARFRREDKEFLEKHPHLKEFKLNPKEFLYAIDHGPMDYGDEFNFGNKTK
jgi:hypothetical protein